MKQLFVFLMAVSVAVIANAQCPPHCVEFEFTGTGNLLDSPAQFSGTIHSADPRLIGRPWEIVIPDDGWPTDQVERLAYVAATYFEPNYDPSSYTWTAIFPERFRSGPQFVIDPEGEDYVGGDASVSITIMDFNFNGVIEPSELTYLYWSVVWWCFIDCRRGVWSCDELHGGFHGGSIADSPDPYAPQTMDATGWLSCSSGMPVESKSWGAIKEMYR